MRDFGYNSQLSATLREGEEVHQVERMVEARRASVLGIVRRTPRRQSSALSIGVTVAARIWLIAIAVHVAAQSYQSVPYQDILAQYRSVQRTDAVARLANASLDDIEAQERYWLRGGADNPPRHASARPADLFAAIMLHTDCAFALATNDSARESRHLELALHLINALAVKHPAPTPFLRSWFLATGMFLHANADLSSAETILDSGLSLYPKDAALMLERGAVAQSRSRVAVDHPFEVPTGIRAQRDDLRTAEKFYRLAVTVDPGSTEARLRLAHVRSPGRDDESAQVYGSILAGGAPPNVTYLANLFLADIHSRHGRPGEAEACLRAAIAQYPSAQAARVALAKVLMDAGRTEEAIAVVQASVSLDLPKRPVDPWSSYLLTQLQSFDELLKRLHDEVRP